MYSGGGKRALDAAAAAVLLLILLPLLLLVALAVRAGLGAPVLFRQERAGAGGRPFALLKFRTMRAAAGEDAARLTRLGRLLRALALDELPQLLHILRGEMSLVGPRPLPVAYLALYTPREALRLGVRPGLCGLAQSMGRNAVPWAERLEWDARYAEAPPTLPGDLRILARCLAVLARGEGVAAPGHATMPGLTPDRGAPKAGP